MTKPEWDLDIDVHRATERILGEREQRLNQAKQILKTGIPYLDVAVGGIRRHDLLLIGAASGAGKTEIATQIAKTNVESGKRVHFFALEAEEREIERRILYKLIAQAFFKDPERRSIEISYRDWYDGKLDHELEEYETEANRVFDEKYQNLFTVYRKREFTVDHFRRYFMAIKDQTDLVVIDHLNYFDLDDPRHENHAVTETVKTIRDHALLYGIPIVLIAHLKKRDRREKGLLPGLEDFMGSSNIYKIATQAVLIGPAPRADYDTGKEWPTFIRAGKFRIEGSATRFIARCKFNTQRNAYESRYLLGLYREDATEFEPLDPSHPLYPRWGKEFGKP